MTNNPPKTKWEKTLLACGLFRHTLIVNGNQSPFFVDESYSAGHRTYGSRFGLWGAGMGVMSQAGYRIAGCFGCGDKISPLKRRAEQMATA